MYLAHQAKACSFWLLFSDILFINIFLKSKITKLLSKVTPRNFSLELPSIDEFLIVMDFKLNGDRNEWHLEEFTLKLLQNRSKKLSIIVSSCDKTSKYMG